MNPRELFARGRLLLSSADFDEAVAAYAPKVEGGAFVMVTAHGPVRIVRDASTPTGYRCMECGTVSADGSAHADGCGQPDRDREASRARWCEQIASLIPPTPDRGKPAPSDRYGFRIVDTPPPGPGAFAALVARERAAALLQLDAEDERMATGMFGNTGGPVVGLPLLAADPYRTPCRPVPPRTALVNPVAFFAITRRVVNPEIHAESLQHVTPEWEPRPHLSVATADGPWRIIPDPDCPIDYAWPETPPPEVAEVVRAGIADARRGEW